MTDIREGIQASLASMASTSLRASATEFLAILGYHSSRTINLGDSSPKAFLEFVRSFAVEAAFNESKALLDDWKSADLLFQLTDGELSGQQSLFKETEINTGLLRSYLFFAIELNGDNYARSTLTGIARQINRIFPMPVMVLIKHLSDKRPVLSVAVINRRQSKREAAQDVLGKVTIIREISLSAPHRGHLDILASFAVQNLVHPQYLPINNFDTLHAAWEGIFNVELLNKRFYRELSNWYFWALPQVEFPADTEKDDERRRATSLIRLLTRLIFCWFLKEKGLIPERLFNDSSLRRILNNLEPDSYTYHQGILQNLFFATLNQRMGKDKNGQPFRLFARDEGFKKNRTTYGVDTLYRYEEHFLDPDTGPDHFADVPFLNGGLFECLDRIEEGTERKIYIDGFSRNPEKRPQVPNRLFFAEEHSVDLSHAYGEPKRRHEKVRGLLRILHAYKFTVIENTPIDQEIALDPELLGKVFENLLASYNEETKSTARKQTGSFYTPRPIVEYMVDESLKAYLTDALLKAGMSEKDVQIGLEILFTYTERTHPFSDREVDSLLDAIHTCKILDPACGSGAFPMGMLQRLVYIIHKLDPANAKWQQLQIDSAVKIPDPMARDAAVLAIERDFSDNEDDYGRKLYLIENCLYGVDIQPIAIQIAKLRFFISLICDQKTNRNKKENHGIRPLPNLETKFVAADTLIGLPRMDPRILVDPSVYRIEAEIETLYHSHFSIQRRDQKLALQRKIKTLRKELSRLIAQSFLSSTKSQHVAEWDPFDPQASAAFFDPNLMYGRALATGFDIILGNPPYIQIQKFPAAQKASWNAQNYSTYSATSDVYCLFYERGAQLLRDGGHLCYITSNKWMRAGYGAQLRSFLSTAVDITSVLDFGMAQNFGAATTYTCIVQFTKQPSRGKSLTCFATDDRAAMADPAGYFEQNKVLLRHLSSSPWVVLSKPRQRIKDLVEAQGIQLDSWDININYGIKTGLNKAFYLTQDQYDAFLARDPKCAELLVPLLRGRDIKRYGTDWDGIWMINAHNGVPSLGIPRIDVRRDYPLFWEHLLQWEYELKERQDRGEHWSNLRSCAYLKEFNQPKIILQEIAISLPFFFDTSRSMFIDTTCFMITSTSASLPYLVSVLNSSLFRCCFRDNFPEYSGNAFRVKKLFLGQVPVKLPSLPEVQVFEALVPLVQTAIATNEASYARFFEDLIDACVMECYFREHMAARDLLLIEYLRPQLAPIHSNSNSVMPRELLAQIYSTLNAPNSKIRNRLIRISAESPDLLAIIREEGRV